MLGPTHRSEHTRCSPLIGPYPGLDHHMVAVFPLSCDHFVPFVVQFVARPLWFVYQSSLCSPSLSPLLFFCEEVFFSPVPPPPRGAEVGGGFVWYRARMLTSRRALYAMSGRWCLRHGRLAGKYAGNAETKAAISGFGRIGRTEKSFDTVINAGSMTTQQK